MKIILFSVSFFLLVPKLSSVDLAPYYLFPSPKIKCVFNMAISPLEEICKCPHAGFWSRLVSWYGQKALARPCLHLLYVKTGLLKILSEVPSSCQKNLFLLYSKTNYQIKHSMENPDEVFLYPLGKKSN